MKKKEILKEPCDAGAGWVFLTPPYIKGSFFCPFCRFRMAEVALTCQNVVLGGVGGGGGGTPPPPLPPPNHIFG